MNDSARTTHPISQAFDLLKPGLPAALFHPESVSRLRSYTSALAPLCALQMGFECRLSAEDLRVDLQQCLIASRGHLKTFLHALHPSNGPIIWGIQDEAEENADVSPTWPRLWAFVEQWCQDSTSWTTALQELWLEFDVDANPVKRQIPSLFIGLKGHLPEPSRSYRAVADALELLGVDWALHSSLRRNLEHCFNVPIPNTISHVGVMLSRRPVVLRVAIKDLPLEKMGDYLRFIEWPGDNQHVEELLQSLSLLVDEVRFLIDISEEAITSPRLGLECFIRPTSKSARRWKAFSQWLVEQGLGSAAKCQALLDWPQHITPLQTSLPWPEYLIVESLWQNLEQLVVIERRLNHIKLDISPQRLEAKAYIGVVRNWAQAASGA